MGLNFDEPSTDPTATLNSFMVTLYSGSHVLSLSQGSRLFANTFSGIEASLSDVTGGPESFAIAKVSGVTATPEPASFVLLGTGLIGLLGAGYRQRKQNAG